MTTDKAASPVVHEPDCNVRMADVRRQLMGCDCEARHRKAAAPVGAVPQGDDGSLRERIELSLQCNQPETEVEYAWSSLLRQAAAALASQAARMGEWIDVNDRLPEDYGWYHCAVEGVGDLGLARWHEVVSLGLYAEHGKRFSTGGGARVTHWKPLGPLPAPPAAIDNLRGEAG